MGKVPQRRWVIVSAIALLAIAVGLLYAWTNRTGCFSYSNYQRIQDGMTREQVTEVLGSPGEETKTVPEFAAQLPGASPGWTGVVWGDTFVHSQEGDRDIYVGFAAGRVTSKYYGEPTSL